jgi:hypothetical protein
VENRTTVDSRRILRLALGTALAIAFSQAVNWPISFVTPIIAGLLLSLPLPAPSLKMTLIVMGVLAGTFLFSFLLLPYLYHARAAGVVLVSLALFGSFYVTAAGGSALTGTLLTLSLTLLTTIGSVSIDAFMDLTKGLLWSALIGIVFTWIAHALLPDQPKPSLPVAGGGEKPEPARPESNEAVRSAFRSVVIVFPVMLLFLFLSTSSAYTVIMIKIATMGQQATSMKGRELSREFLASTFWGGLGAVVAWLAMKVFPSLVLYSLLIALAALIYGRGIFRAGSMHPKATMWQYAFITMITVLGPTVGSMASGQSASDKFFVRLVYFGIVAVYGWLAVTVFDGFWKGRTADHASPVSEPIKS